MANEHSQIVPSMQPTSTVADFKFWCQKVLPLVYDDSISYYEVLGKMVVYLNQVIDNINADTANVAELEDDFLLLQTYVNNFFDDIDQLVTYAERAEAAETAALSSAASAAESATNAASSAVNAATSSGSAATSALSAMDAKDAAVAAKTAAETALANAQTAATNAANSATTASGAATNAAASATAAQQSFTLADAARTAAQSAARSAESSAQEAQDILESIPEDYTDLSVDVSKIQTMVNPNGIPYLPLGHAKRKIDQQESSTLIGERIGNVIKLTGTRSDYPNYITLLDLKNRGSTASDYGTINDFIDSLQSGKFIITVSGSITSETITSGVMIAFYACEYVENPTALENGKIGTVALDAPQYTDAHNNIILELNIPAHTKPVRLIMLARFNTYDCTITFRFEKS